MSANDGGDGMDLSTASPHGGVEERPGGSVRAPSDDEGGMEGATRRLAALSGVITILILDLLALDDITTAGEWAVEFAFLVASLPALLFLGRMALRKPRDAAQLEERTGPRRWARELTAGVARVDRC